MRGRIVKYKNTVLVSTVVVLSFIVCITLKQTETSLTIERSDLKFSEMIYQHVDESKVQTLCAGPTSKSADKKESFKQKTSWRRDFEELYNEISTMRTLAEIKYYMGDQTMNYFEEYNYCESLLLEMEDSYNAMYSEDYSEEESAENSSLYMEQLRLRGAYRDLENTVAVDEGYTLEDIGKMSEAEREKYYSEWDEAYKEEAGKVLIALAKNQNAMATAYGYDSTAQMLYEQYGRDFTPEEAKAFYGYVKEYVTPVLRQLLIEQSNTYIPNQIFTYDEESVLNGFEKQLTHLSPRFNEAFDYMRQYELYNIYYDEAYEKNDEAYTWYIDAYHEPFIYISGQDSSIIADSLVHEFGHFFANFESSDPYYSVDIDETFSQGMEALLLPRMGEMMKSEEIGALLQIDVLTGMLSAVAEGCLYDEFLEELFEDPEITVAEMDEKFNKLVDAYGLTGCGYTWETVQHNYDTPMYYMSYSISAIPALELWENVQDNEKEAVNKYLSIIEKAEDMDFRENIETAGFGDPFDKETLIEILNRICKEYGFEEVA